MASNSSGATGRIGGDAALPAPRIVKSGALLLAPAFEINLALIEARQLKLSMAATATAQRVLFLPQDFAAVDAYIAKLEAAKRASNALDQDVLEASSLARNYNDRDAFLAKEIAEKRLVVGSELHNHFVAVQADMRQEAVAAITACGDRFFEVHGEESS